MPETFRRKAQLRWTSEHEKKFKRKQTSCNHLSSNVPVLERMLSFQEEKDNTSNVPIKQEKNKQNNTTYHEPPW